MVLASDNGTFSSRVASVEPTRAHMEWLRARPGGVLRLDENNTRQLSVNGSADGGVALDAAS
jgi:hypothetical protein